MIQVQPKVFALINDFRRWGSWSPYERLDPTMQRTYTGAMSGKGSVYEWDGNRNVGKGHVEITDAIQPSKVMITLDTIRPFEGHTGLSSDWKPAATRRTPRGPWTVGVALLRGS